MAVFISDCNTYCRDIDLVNELAMGSTTFSGSGDVRTLLVYGLPANLHNEIFLKTSTGTLTAAICLLANATDTPNFGAPDTSCVGSTAGVLASFATTDDKRWVAIQLTPSAALTLNSKFLRAMDKFPISHNKSQGYHEAESGFNKVSQAAGYTPMSI